MLGGDLLATCLTYLPSRLTSITIFGPDLGIWVEEYFPLVGQEH